MPETVLIIACGALAREVDALKRRYGWQHVEMQCIDARLHNRPDRIPARLREKLRQAAGRYDRVFIAYADCGTRGEIDRVVAEAGAERLPGAHCYQFFAGTERFETMAAADPGTFFLTDFLARNFERLVWRPLQLDLHPQLRQVFFGNYRRLVYLSQTRDPDLLREARLAAGRLELEFRHEYCGYGELEKRLVATVNGQRNGKTNARLLA